jgi:hypothetical protein
MGGDVAQRGLVTVSGAVGLPRGGSGAWVRLRRGAYVGTALWSAMSADERHLARVQAVAAAGSAPVFSHWSAAVIWGLPTVARPDERVHVTVPAAGGGRSEGDVVRHARAQPGAPVLVRGLLCTGVARTVVDLARSGGLVAGLVAADAALRARLVDRDELERELAGAGVGRGIRDARLVVAHANPRAESPGESLSRARMIEHGLVLPVLQHELRDDRGLAGRVDFWWPGVRVVGEFDGLVKYGADAGVAVNAVWEEKRREDRLRRLVTGLVRWTWDDAWRAGPMVQLLRHAGVQSSA